LKTTDFTYLLHNPGAISERETAGLERVLSEFPYFQSVAVLRLKGLQNQNDFRYNSELKKIASQTTSRTVLYDLITKENFSHHFFEQKNLYDIEVIDPEIIFSKSISTEEKRKQSILFSIEASEIKNIEPKDDTIVVEDKNTEKLEHSILSSMETSKVENQTNNSQNHTEQSEVKKGMIKKISDSEKFSFTQWLELTQKQRIVVAYQNQIKPTSKKQKKIELIDRFIETNPKIIPRKNSSTKFVFEEKASENPTLMTETLAEVYMKQKKFQKAIEAYEILILKYPKKSSFFADRIDFIKKIQQNNI